MSRRARTAGLLGRAGPAGPRRRVLRGARRARRLRAGAQPHDARLRGARGRLQPGGRGVRRDQRAEEPDSRDGDLRRVRRPRGRPRHARLPLPLRRLRHPGQLGRLPRHRRRAPRPQHRGRGRPRRAPLRRAALRDDARPELERHPAGARRQPDLHDPGARRALHRRRRPDPLRLELAPSSAPESEGDRGRRPHELDRHGCEEPGQQLAARPRRDRLHGPRTRGVRGVPRHPADRGANATWPLVVGIVAVLLGVATLSRGRTRLGIGAVVAGLAGSGSASSPRARASGT